MIVHKVPHPAQPLSSKIFMQAGGFYFQVCVLSSEITGIKISKLIEDSGNKPPCIPLLVNFLDI